jgi:hypothetical protein
MLEQTKQDTQKQTTEWQDFNVQTTINRYHDPVATDSNPTGDLHRVDISLGRYST